VITDSNNKKTKTIDARKGSSRLLKGLLQLSQPDSCIHEEDDDGVMDECYTTEASISGTGSNQLNTHSSSEATTTTTTIRTTTTTTTTALQLLPLPPSVEVITESQSHSQSSTEEPTKMSTGPGNKRKMR
jgi:hypothetical protein